MKPTHLLLIFIFCILLISFFTFLPLSTYAEQPGLVTCGLMGGANVCNICDLITLFQTLVSKANAYFALPLAALMLGYGGFLMVLSGFQGGNAGLFTKGKTVLTNAVVGIVIIFCSWIAIDTLLKTIGAYQHAPSSNFGPWNEITCISPVVKYSKHFECNGDKCEEADGYGIGTCSTDNNSRSCREHFECEKDACVLKPTPGLDKCIDENDKTTCKKPNADLCTGASCPDSSVDTYKPDTTADCRILGNWDSAISNGIGMAGSIGGDIDTENIVKAIISQESHGRIGEVSKAGACGLMQIKPSSGKRFANRCGTTEAEASTCDFYTNPVNATKSICIGTSLLKAPEIISACGRTVRGLAAGFNGGGGGSKDACAPSADCGSAAGPGECKVNAAQEGETKRWECLWEDATHTTCNANKPGGTYEETRRYVPKVLQCYN